MNRQTAQLILHYLTRVVPKGPDEEHELASVIQYLSKIADGR